MKKLSLTIVILLAAITLLTGCVLRSTESGPKRTGEILRVAFPGTPDCLDPHRTCNYEWYVAGESVYSNLTRLDQQLVPQPELAESWEVSKDGLTWTFHLRKDVKFHHGKTLNADDVVFTFNRLMDEKTGSPGRSIMSFVQKVERLDDYTVQFNLASPNADLPVLLAGHFMRIVPSDRSEEQIAQEPVGTGPFRFVEYIPDERIVFERNPDYWEKDEQGRQLPYLDNLEFVFIPEMTTQINALSSAEVDMLWEVGSEAIPGLESNSDIIVAEAASGHHQPIIMNYEQKPFDNPLVRKALKFCVDRPALLQIVTRGKGVLGNDQPIGPGFSWYDPTVSVPEYNPEKAKELLAEAGNPEGLRLDLYTMAGRPGMLETATAFQQMAQACGIEIRLQVLPSSVYWEEAWRVKPLYMGSQWRASVYELFATFYSSTSGERNFADPELDKLIQKAAAETNLERRKELYAEIQKFIAEKGGVIIPYFRPYVLAYRKAVKGFIPAPTKLLDFQGVWQEK